MNGLLRALLVVGVVLYLSFRNIIIIGQQSPKQSQSKNDDTPKQDDHQRSFFQHSSVEQQQQNQQNQTSTAISIDTPVQQVDNQQQETLEECWQQPRCHGKKNVIVYTNSEPAGLNHCTYLFRKLANIAGYLCATLYVPKPSKMLSTIHNDGQHVLPESRWRDYLSMTWKKHSKLLVNVIENPSFMVLNNLQVKKFVNGSGKFLSDQYCSDNAELCLHTTALEEKSHQAWHHLRAAEAFHKQQQHDLGPSSSSSSFGTGNSTYGFIWRLDANFYRTYLQNYPEEELVLSNENRLPLSMNELPPAWPRGIPKQNEHTCDYVDQTTPPQIVDIARNHVWKMIQLVPTYDGDKTLIGYWQIRRRDGKGCDTSLDRMKRFLNCTFWHRSAPSTITASSASRSTRRKEIILLLSTDERKSSYFRNLSEWVHDSNALMVPALKLVRLDEIVSQCIQDFVKIHNASKRFLDNNYYTFSVIQEVEKHVDFIIRHRRTHSCPDCTTIELLEK